MTLIETLTSTLGLKSWLKAADKPMSSQENSGCAEDGPQDPFFNDAAFDKVIEEMDKPDFTGFELFADTRGVQIHRRPEGDSGLYEYKIIGYQPDVDPKYVGDQNDQKFIYFIHFFNDLRFNTLHEN